MIAGGSAGKPGPAGRKTGSEMSAPFFIVGSGRSGSTLLRVILCAHSSVTIPPETYFIDPLISKFPAGQALDDEQVTAAIDIITGHYRWPDMGLSDEEFVASVRRLDRPSVRDILNVIYGYHLEKENKTVWGDKTPPYVSIIPGLVSLYPDVRIIHLIRDGRDVAKSFQATGWYGPWLHDNTREWKDAIRFVRDCRRTHPEIEILEVRYEKLVMETEETIRSLCNYIGIPFEPGMLDWTAGMSERIPEREAHIHSKLAHKPQEKDINRWKTEMSARELLVTEAFISPELVLSGYEPYFSAVAWRPVSLLARLYCNTILPIYSLAARVPGFICRRLPWRSRQER